MAPDEPIPQVRGLATFEPNAKLWVRIVAHELPGLAWDAIYTGPTPEGPWSICDGPGARTTDPGSDEPAQDPERHQDRGQEDLDQDLGRLVVGVAGQGAVWSAPAASHPRPDAPPDQPPAEPHRLSGGGIRERRPQPRERHERASPERDTRHRQRGTDAGRGEAAGRRAPVQRVRDDHGPGRGVLPL